MGVFTRIKVADANEAERLAANHAIEHGVMPFAGPYNEWITFKFTTPHGKAAFDRVCIENDITTQDMVVVSHMLDAIVEGGEAPSDVLESATITPGMARKFGKGRVKYRCSNGACGLAIPVYSGAYSKRCPNCGGELMAAP